MVESMRADSETLEESLLHVFGKEAQTLLYTRSREVDLRDLRRRVLFHASVSASSIQFCREDLAGDSFLEMVR